MKVRKSRWMLAFLFAVFTAFVSSSRAVNTVVPVPPGHPFFDPATYWGRDRNGIDIFYLSYFKAFAFIYDVDGVYFYKYNFGWIYDLSGTDGTDSTTSTVSSPVAAYLYDFSTDDVFYTSSELYPYFYSFNLRSWLYYFEGSSPREFYAFRISGYLFYPATGGTVTD